MLRSNPPLPDPDSRKARTSRASWAKSIDQRRSAKTSRALALGSRTLATGLTQPTTYLMEATEGFDVMLVPVT